MARKVAFAWVTFVYDFDFEEECDRFIKANRGKGWYFGEKSYDRFGGYWTVRVEKPYRDYNCGW